MSELLRVAIPFYTLLAVVAVGLAAWTGESMPILPAPSAGPMLRAVAIGLGMAAAVVGFSCFVSPRFAWGRALARGLRELLGSVRPGDAFWLALFSSVGEELFFRGALQPWVGWLPASVAFGLVHFGPRRDLLAWPVLAMSVGLLFGAAVESTGSILPALVAHFAVNWIELSRLARVAPTAGRC